MANHNLPTQSSTYVNFVTELDSRLDDLALGLDPARTTMTNLPVNSVSWSSTENKWKRWTGSAWADLTTTYAVNVATVTNGVYTVGNQTIAGIKTFSSDIAGSITGNAATVTNGVYTTGNQTIAGIKTFSSAIAGSITGNAATVTNGVYTTGNQTIDGLKTFSTAIAGSITGNAATVTNGVYTIGTQTIEGTKTFSGSIQVASIGIGTPASGTAGEIRATNNITAYYSDIRLKENIVPISNALESLKKIRGVRFNSNNLAESFGYRDKRTQVGVIAQEIELVLPELVVPAPFDIAVSEEGVEYSRSGENYKTVQYDKIVALLIESVKELNEKLELLSIGAKL